MLRQAGVELGKGRKMSEVYKQLDISEPTFYHWCQKYGGMDPQMAKQLKELEKENARLKMLVADLSLDKQMLEEVARGNF